MTIKTGDHLPDATFTVMGEAGPAPVTTAEFFGGKKVALFAVPGAYTPTCSQQHVQGFVERVGELKAKGIDAVACTAVNDVFVMDHFAGDTNAKGKIAMLADGNGDFARAIGLEIDLTKFGLGVRSKRYSMLVEDGVVTSLNIDESPPVHDQSSAATLCSIIDRSL